MEPKFVAINFLALIISLTPVLANSDGQCCRKRIECFECDSRFDARCGEPFNMTRENGNFIQCDDLCVKLRHKFGNQFYYIRSCADQFKNILIKKTDVCYTTRKKDGSNLCFCDQERCNDSNSIYYQFKFYKTLAIRTFTQVILLIVCLNYLNIKN